MVVSTVVKKKFVAMAPDLHEGAGVLLCNPERTAVLAQLRAENAHGCFDDGGSGHTALETAARIMGSGFAAVRIVAGPRDQRAARILQEACIGAGLDATVDVVLPAPLAGTESVLHVPETAQGNELLTWLARCRAACRQLGCHRVRIAPRPLPAIPACPGRRSPLPGLDLDEPEWRAALVALVAECWPRNLLPFLAVLGAHDLGSNLLEDVYAGLGLRERNAELLVNIVDCP